MTREEVEEWLIEYAPDAVCNRFLELRTGCRHARACLLNLQPAEMNPMAQQMQRMIHELSLTLD